MNNLGADGDERKQPDGQNGSLRAADAGEEDFGVTREPEARPLSVEEARQAVERAIHADYEVSDERFATRFRALDAFEAAIVSREHERIDGIVKAARAHAERCTGTLELRDALIAALLPAKIADESPDAKTGQEEARSGSPDGGNGAVGGAEGNQR